LGKKEKKNMKLNGKGVLKIRFYGKRKEIDKLDEKR
jgi:hypothetical protein